MSFRENKCRWVTKNAAHIGANHCILDDGHEGGHVWPSQSSSDCQEEDGITVGLVDSLMAIGKVLVPRLAMLPKSHAVDEAMQDLRSDISLRELFTER